MCVKLSILKSGFYYIQVLCFKYNGSQWASIDTNALGYITSNNSYTVYKFMIMSLFTVHQSVKPSILKFERGFMAYNLCYEYNGSQWALMHCITSNNSQTFHAIIMRIFKV